MAKVLPPPGGDENARAVRVEEFHQNRGSRPVKAVAFEVHWRVSKSRAMGRIPELETKADSPEIAALEVEVRAFGAA